MIEVPAELVSLQEWFQGYCCSFYTTDATESRNLFLKEIHTHQVCEAIGKIAKEEGGSGRELLLAQVIALFHDLGRFRQYREYRTFKDSESVNHAALGAKILLEEGVLGRFSSHERELIIRAVQLHNVFALPANLSPEERHFLMLIRDADKIDIWRVFIEYYSLPEEERATAVGLGLPDLPGCSGEVLDCLQRGEMVRLAMLKSLNDFKLLQLSWVYDINFASSFRLIQQRRIIDQLAETLPNDVRMHAKLETLQAFAKRSAERGTDGRSRI